MSTLASPLPNLDYCQTISFRTEPFDRQKLEEASRRSDCRSAKAPLAYKDQGRLITDFFTLSADARPGGTVEFVRYDKNSETYLFDESSFNQEIHLGKGKYKGIVSYLPTIHVNHKTTGSTIVCTILFFDKKQNIRKIGKYIYFFKPGSYAAQYLNEVDAQDASALKMLIAIEELFLTMEISW
jgi:hypothetical protein